jgi:peroxiredoxin
MRKCVLLLAVILTALVSVEAVFAVPKALPTGAAAPDFKLKDHAGKEYALSQWRGSVVVLDFCSIECPYSKGVDGDLLKLQANYAGKKVVFVGINSNADTDIEQIEKYATERKLPWPILKDVGNKYADAIGAGRTPEFFVLDRDLKVAYHGAYDNRKTPPVAGSQNYVRKTVDALLAGKPVEPTEMDAFGCAITRVK